MCGQDGRRGSGFREKRKGKLRRREAAAVGGAVLCVGEHIDVRGAAVTVVVMVVVGIVAVVMDGLAGDVAVEPHEVPAAVVMAGMDAETHVGEYIGDSRQQAEEVTRGAFHPCKSKD